MALQIIRVAGSHKNSLNGVENVLVPNPDTRYSSKGLGSYIDLEIANADTIAGVQVGFYKGSQRMTKFSVASTNDFVKFDHIQNFASSGLTDSVESFEFEKPVKAKGLRISFLGSYKIGTTFDETVIETFPSNTTTFASGVALTDALVAPAVVGADDGTVNDWFSVTMVALLGKTQAQMKDDEEKAVEKAQSKELKQLQKDVKDLKKDKNSDESDNGDEVDKVIGTKGEAYGERENANDNNTETNERKLDAHVFGTGKVGQTLEENQEKEYNDVTGKNIDVNKSTYGDGNKSQGTTGTTGTGKPVDQVLSDKSIIKKQVDAHKDDTPVKPAAATNASTTATGPAPATKANNNQPQTTATKKTNKDGSVVESDTKTTTTIK